MSEVPTRREWRAEEDAKSGVVLVQPMMAFGWKVHRHVMPVGSTLITRAAAPIARANSANLTLYVRGQATLSHEDGSIYPNRVPGMFSGDRPDTPAGSITTSVLEKLEFWCFNWHANKGRLPEVSVLRLAAGEQLQAAAGQRVLTCFGDLGPYPFGTAFVHDGSALVAAGQVYGFLIGGANV